MTFPEFAEIDRRRNLASSILASILTSILASILASLLASLLLMNISLRREPRMTTASPQLPVCARKKRMLFCYYSLCGSSSPWFVSSPNICGGDSFKKKYSALCIFLNLYHLHRQRLRACRRRELGFAAALGYISICPFDRAQYDFLLLASAGLTFFAVTAVFSFEPGFMRR